MADNGNYRVDKAGLAFIAHVGVTCVSLHLSNPDFSVVCDMPVEEAVALARAVSWPNVEPDGFLSDIMEGTIVHVEFGHDGRICGIGDVFGKSHVKLG